MPIVDPQNVHNCLVRTGEAHHDLAEGIGCNFLISNQSALPPVDDPQRWDRVLEALDDLRVGWMRVGVIPTDDGGAWDDDRQQWDLEHPHFIAARRVGEWAASRGVRLMFDPFVIPPSFRSGGAFFADDPRHCARRLILPVVEHFRERGLDCYRYLGLINEAIWGPDKEGFPAVREFHDLYAGVRAVLDEAGIDQAQLGLLGPSNLSDWEWPIADFIAAGLDPDPLWAGYDQHLYLYHFDWMQDNAPDFMPLSEAERYLRRYADYAHKRHKPLFVTELGNMYCGRLFWGERDFEGPASHLSVLMDAELIVRALNHGVDGFLRWAFCVRPDRDGRWSLLENTPEGMVPSPSAYPIYRLLMRAVPVGATVLRTEVRVSEAGFRYVFAAAVRHQEQACLLLINDMPGRNLDVGLALDAPFRGRTLHRAVCDQTRRGDLLPAIDVSDASEAVVMLPPLSLTVLSLEPLG